MNFKKYVLECACLCALCSGVAFAAYSGTDPEIEKIKESIKKLEGETNELKETDEEFGTKTESQQKTLEEAKKSVDQMQERLTALEDSQKKDEDTSAQMEESNKKIAELDKEISQIQEKITALEDAQKNSSDTSTQVETLNKDIETLKTNFDALSKDAGASEKINEIKTDVDELKKKAQDQSKLQDQSKIDEQQNLEIAKIASKVEKLEKSNNAAAVGHVTGLLGTVAKGGIGLLSQYLDSKSNATSSSNAVAPVMSLPGSTSSKLAPAKIKEMVSNGKPTEEITKDMTPEERSAFEAIEQDIKSGKSEQEIQAKFETLQQKVSDRETNEVLDEIKKSKFKKLNFFGLNEAFSPTRVAETVSQIYELSEDAEEAPKAAMILSGKINPIDQELINDIYGMVSEGATLQDIFEFIGFHTEGNPLRIASTAPKNARVAAMIAAAEKQAEKAQLEQNNQINPNDEQVTRGVIQKVRNKTIAQKIAPFVNDVSEQNSPEVQNGQLEMQQNLDAKSAATDGMGQQLNSMPTDLSVTDNNQQTQEATNRMALQSNVLPDITNTDQQIQEVTAGQATLQSSSTPDVLGDTDGDQQIKSTTQMNQQSGVTPFVPGVTNNGQQAKPTAARMNQRADYMPTVPGFINDGQQIRSTNQINQQSGVTPFAPSVANNGQQSKPTAARMNQRADYMPTVPGFINDGQQIKSTIQMNQQSSVTPFAPSVANNGQQSKIATTKANLWLGSVPFAQRIARNDQQTRTTNAQLAQQPASTPSVQNNSASGVQSYATPRQTAQQGNLRQVTQGMNAGNSQQTRVATGTTNTQTTQVGNLIKSQLLTTSNTARFMGQPFQQKFGMQSMKQKIANGEVEILRGSDGRLMAFDKDVVAKYGTPIPPEGVLVMQPLDSKANELLAKRLLKAGKRTS